MKTLPVELFGEASVEKVVKNNPEKVKHNVID